MKLAFCLFRYFPFGGLQRDFLRIALKAVELEHDVDVYTMKWEGPIDPRLNIHLVPVNAVQNHTRGEKFAKQVQKITQSKNYDCIIGFNKMPGLDIYYAADVCYQARIREQRSPAYRLLPRYQSYLRMEKSVFESDTHVLVLSDIQRQQYYRNYHLPLNHFHVLPPGIAKDRLAPPNAAEIRQRLRAQYSVGTDEQILLLVGSGFKTKGLDRILQGLAALPKTLQAITKLWVVGQDKATPFLKQAKALNILPLVHFFGGRHDVNRFFLAADLLVHPAYHENTGTVLLEALAAGLPVLTVDACGYAPYIKQAQAGRVLASPFNQQDFNSLLHETCLADKTQWRQNALDFARSADIYNLPDKAIQLIESIAQSRTFSFDEYMKLQGQPFRALNGRSTQRVILNNQAYFIKQHFGVGFKEIIKNLLQFKKPILGAKNEWQAIAKLQSLAVGTAEVVAFGSRGRNPATQKSFLLMKELSDTISLEHLCHEWKVKKPSFSLKYALIQEVARISKVMHENGINHRDFYLCHFLMNLKNPPQLYLIDLHRAGFHRRLRKRWIIKDLAGLYFSSKDIGLTQRDLLRFIKAYRQQPLRDIIATDIQFWRKTVARGEKLYDAHAGSQ